jgi:nitrogenase molybdenum-iron protein alpha/beta subunit
MEDWQRLPVGALNVVIDKELFTSLTSSMQSELGVPFIEIPLPEGVSGTDAFFLKIASHFKKKEAMKEVLQDPELAGDRKKAMAAVAKFSAKWKGMKLAYNIGTDRNYYHLISAKDGLCEVNFFRELGFDVTLLVQGNPEPKRILMIRKQLKEMKIEADIDIFVDNVSMTPALRKKDYGLVYCVGAMAEMVRPTKIPMIALADLNLGYDGCLYNLFLIEKALARKTE